MQHIGRNDPCPCGSGQKYKRCCGVAPRKLVLPYLCLDAEDGRGSGRVLIVRRDLMLPDDEYCMAEAYCVDPDCRCQWVWFSMLARRQERCFAVLRYDLDPDAADPGPVAEPKVVQTGFAPQLIELVAHILDEHPEFVEVFRSHLHRTREEAARRRAQGECLPGLHPEDLKIDGTSGFAHRDLPRRN